MNEASNANNGLCYQKNVINQGSVSSISVTNSFLSYVYFGFNDRGNPFFENRLQNIVNLISACMGATKQY